MRILFIGGTGTISQAITRKLVEDGEEVILVNRGNRNGEFEGKVKQITVKDVNDEEEFSSAIRKFLDNQGAGTGEKFFDSVCDFIGFHKEQIERDVRIFKGNTKQFMYISSASAYHKPVKDYVITEGTSLANPYWQYSRDKIECEDYLMEEYKKGGVIPMMKEVCLWGFMERTVPIR